MRPRPLAFAFLAVLSALAGPGAASAQRAGSSALHDYAGTYRYHGGTIALVANDTMLFAVLEEAKYPLRAAGPDRVVNGAGDTIPFRRDAAGAVEGFVERGTFFARLSPEVDAATVAIVRTRPREAGPYVYRPPAGLGDGIAVGDLASAGLDTAVANALVRGVESGRFGDLHGVLVYRRGRLVLEEYFHGYDRDRPHQMRSATKSVVSALVGIAVDSGALAGEAEPVLPRLGYASLANPDPRKAALTLGDLLTHRTGLACDDWDPRSPGNESRVYESDDWVKTFLDLPVIAERGTTARYCSAGVLTAGRMVERATGQALPAYAQRVLFDPLGIRASDVRWTFTLSANGGAGTFAQLRMRPRDMLKLGLLFAQEGRWNGRQVVSAGWVRRSTAEHARIGSSGYGYYWWHRWLGVPTPSGVRRVDTISASGNGGQKIFLVPSLDLVAVFTGGAYNADEEPPNRVMVEVLLPALLAERTP
ncbi:MAG TPA: serine hydrolase [Longimicrobium sp.]|nr:serine hydrolase [Longimicrobium sp.]